MSLHGLTVGIIGGSIAGCAAAIALRRAGCDVTVFERSATGLMDRGSGIAIPGPLRAQLIAAGYLPAGFASCEMARRWWQFPDGSERGRRIWTQPTPAFANNWGNLWSALRAGVPDDRYFDGARLTSFTEDATGVTVRFVDDTTRTFDLLIGADGYGSAVRAVLHPQAAPHSAGYVLWRGNYPEARVADQSLIAATDAEQAWLTVPFPGGHGVLYMIPGFDGGTAPGTRRVNWAIYAAPPAGQPLDPVASVPPGAVTADAFAAFQDLLATRFPPAIRALIAGSAREEVSIQPIYDSIVPSYVSRRVLLIGDAGTITRPHTASGATKALEDALALETLAQEAADLPGLLARYDAARCETARNLAEIGRRIGRAQVTDTPDWGAMSEEDFVTWTRATLAGDTLYLYGEKV